MRRKLAGALSYTLLLLAAILYWRPAVRHPAILALLLLDPIMWNGVMQFQLATFWSFAFAFFAAASLDRKRHLRGSLLATLAVAIHPLMAPRASPDRAQAVSFDCSVKADILMMPLLSPRSARVVASPVKPKAKARAPYALTPRDRTRIAVVGTASSSPTTVVDPIVRPPRATTRISRAGRDVVLSLG